MSATEWLFATHSIIPNQLRKLQEDGKGKEKQKLPESLLVAKTAYGVKQASQPSFLNTISITLTICITNWSCLKSSLAL